MSVLQDKSREMVIRELQRTVSGGACGRDPRAELEGEGEGGLESGYSTI